jgi:hypothetical protein
MASPPHHQNCPIAPSVLQDVLEQAFLQERYDLANVWNRVTGLCERAFRCRHYACARSSCAHVFFSERPYTVGLYLPEFPPGSVIQTGAIEVGAQCVRGRMVPPTKVHYILARSVDG